MDWYAYFKEEAERRGIATRVSELGRRPDSIEAMILKDPVRQPTTNPEFIQKIEIDHSPCHLITTSASLQRNWYNPDEVSHPYHIVMYWLVLEVRRRRDIVRLDFAMGHKTAVLGGAIEDRPETELDKLVKQGYSLATRHDNKTLIDCTLDTYQRLTT